MVKPKPIGRILVCFPVVGRHGIEACGGLGLRSSRAFFDCGVEVAGASGHSGETLESLKARSDGNGREV